MIIVSISKSYLKTHVRTNKSSANVKTGNSEKKIDEALYNYYS